VEDRENRVIVRVEITRQMARKEKRGVYGKWVLKKYLRKVIARG
jgi:hypothetical protein